MKNYTHFLGVDVSKKTLDLALYNASGELLHEATIENTQKAVRSFCVKLKKEFGDNFFPNLLVCLEHTGCYTFKILQVLDKQGIDTWLENPFVIKRSLGLQRGKNDKADARRIAEYARRFWDNARLYKSKPKHLRELSALYKARQSLVKKKMQLKQAFTSEAGFHSKEEKEVYKSCFSKTIEVLTTEIIACNEKIKACIEAQETLKAQDRILQSIPGVGLQNSALLLTVTEEFTRFETPEQLSCYIGAAPFEHSSGTSVRGRARTSKMGNLKVKSMLHLAARSAVRSNSFFKKYYERKLEEGKKKMSALNAVINKIIHCAFALIRKDEMYDRNYKYSPNT